MANIFVNIEKGVEVGASDLLKWLSSASTVATKEVAAAPTVLAALGTLLGSLESAITGASSIASSGGLNIALDEAEFAAIKGIWPEIKTFISAVVPAVKL
jgi:hypothetical protein